MITNLIFDFDGTIVDSLYATFDVFNQISDEFGFRKVDTNEIERLRIVGTKGVIKALGMPVYKLPFIAIRVRQELARKLNSLKPIIGIRETLFQLRHKQIELGIVTTNSEVNVRKFLIKNDIDVFNYIYGGGNIFGKHQIIKQVLKDKKIPLDQTVYIGDETRDIEAAHKCHMKVAAVCWGFSTKDILAAHKPDWVVDNPADLLNLVS